MKRTMTAAAFASALLLAPVCTFAQSGESGAPVAAPAAGTALGSVTLPRKVMADGKPLAAGTYQVRLTGDEAKPAAGQSPNAERYVEFLRGGQVVGREVATVVSGPDIAAVAKGGKPANGAARVEMLKGDDYLRVWINRGGHNYLIHLPPGA
jgi:hypothetical protein